MLQFSVNKLRAAAFLSINSPVKILTSLGRGCHLKVGTGSADKRYQVQEEKPLKFLHVFY